MYLVYILLVCARILCFVLGDYFIVELKYVNLHNKNNMFHLTEK